MLRTNLSTRPFYNERVVHLALGVGALVVIAVTAFNATRAWTLSKHHTELTARAEQSEAAAEEVAREAAAIRRQLDRTELETIAAAAREANSIIDRRIFSWTEFFNRIEMTLPSDVMMTSVRPEIQEDVVTVSMVVLGRRVEDIDTFMEQLEATGAFAELLARQEEITDEGMYRSALRGRYLGQGGETGPPRDTSGRGAAPLE